jgi:hypothetical protein
MGHKEIIYGLSLSLILRLTVSRSVYLGIKHPSEAYDQILITVRQLRDLLVWGVLSDKRTGLSLTIAAGPRQCSHFRVRVPWNSWPYFTVSDLRLLFSSPPTTRRVMVEVLDPAFTGECMDWIKLVQGMDQLRTVVKTIMNLGVM